MKGFIVITAIIFATSLVSSALNEHMRIVDFVMLSYIMFNRLDLHREDK